MPIASSLDEGTHYDRHRSTLHSPAKNMQPNQYFPPRFSFLLASDQNDTICDKRHALYDDCE